MLCLAINVNIILIAFNLIASNMFVDLQRQYCTIKLELNKGEINLKVSCHNRKSQ